MSDPKAQTAEPTMEEILASIRRIISENDEEQEAKKKVEAAAAPPPPSSAPEPQPEPAPQPPPEPEPSPVAPESAVLELTEMVTEDGSIVSLTEADKLPEAVDSDYIVEAPGNIENAASATGEDEEQTSDEEAGKAETMMETPKDDAMDNAPKPDSAPPSAEEGLISAAASAAATANFAQLARSMAQEPPTSGNMPLGSSDRTLEDIVKEMIRPMLKDWLDRNLPQMVEHMVRRELDRMTRKATDI